ncbi:unnamed protein product [Ranitomeya imitator]|uniref:NXPE family member 1 n=1 Tax=Ranitomeya imitator TaxID=111125 RepID=A0ABN9MP01_9NEOB|nr:unnamed protein product [Ranitomeya imitator]
MGEDELRMNLGPLDPAEAFPAPRDAPVTGPCIAVSRDDDVVVSRDCYIIIWRDCDALLGPECREEHRRTNRMSKPNTIQFKMVLGLAIFFITLLSFIIHLQPNYIKILSNHCLSVFEKTNTSFPSNEPNSIDIQISELMTLIDRTVPNVDFSFFNDTTSAKNSTATIVEKKPNYCVGDTITIRVEMCNFLGEKKSYGGDFLRARIFSTKLGAGASGEIKDFKNGTYNVYFTLFWEGEVKISVLLMHPSEGVSALWKSRNLGYKYIKYTGKFLNKSQEVVTECGFSLDTKGDKCNYVDKRYGESFYCIKPPGVACEAFVSLKSGNNPYTYLTKVQKNLFSLTPGPLEAEQEVIAYNVAQIFEQPRSQESNGGKVSEEVDDDEAKLPETSIFKMTTSVTSWKHCSIVSGKQQQAVLKQISIGDKPHNAEELWTTLKEQADLCLTSMNLQPGGGSGAR